jgi:hypothetical protein
MRLAYVTAAAMSASLPLLSEDRRRAKPAYVCECMGSQPSGTVSWWPGGRMRYFPPLPLSTPAGPTSSMAVCQASSTEPTSEPEPSAGGISSTTGPASFVSKKGMT